MPLRAAIIGAGKIGAFLDRPDDRDVVTHAHGYKADDGFELAGFVDRDLERAEKACGIWGGHAFESIENLFDTEQVDVVSVCVPDELHYEVLLTLAKSPVKLIFLEKPAVSTNEQAGVIRRLYDDLPIKVLVNYTRRFVPEINKVRRAIRDGSYGSFLTGVGYYGKGLLHNGSHLLDLIQFLLGHIKQTRRIGEEIVDFRESDPSISGLLTLNVCASIYLRNVDCRKFEIFELDLTFEKKRIRIRDFGTVIEEYSVGESETFKGYRSLHKDAEYTTDYRRAMQYAVANIRNHLELGEALICPLDESLAIVTMCRDLLQREAAFQE